MFSGWFFPLASTYHWCPGRGSKFLISLGCLCLWSDPKLNRSPRWLWVLAFPLSFQPAGLQDPSPPHLSPFFSHISFTHAVTHGFLHTFQHHLPLAAIAKPGSLRCDSFLPLLLDIQTGGQRALSEIPAWGRELRGLSDKQPE